MVGTEASSSVGLVWTLRYRAAWDMALTELCRLEPGLDARRFHALMVRTVPPKIVQGVFARLWASSNAALLVLPTKLDVRPWLLGILAEVSSSNDVLMFCRTSVVSAVDGHLPHSVSHLLESRLVRAVRHGARSAPSMARRVAACN